VRARGSLGPKFETPVTNGRHWDVSDIDIVVPSVEESKEEVDDDEIEYMAPTAIGT